MALRLRVVSEHSQRMGSQATKLFGVHGGSIGRSFDNDWILPDPERYLSGKHARIDFRAGTYVLVDTSSNGTYVNGAQVPLGKYHDYPLKDGDYVRLGEFELLVSIDKTNDFPPDDSAIVAYDGQAPSAAAKKATADDLGAELDLSALLEPSDSLPSPPDAAVRARDAYGQALNAATSEPPAPAGGAPWHMLTRPLKVEAAKPSATPPPTRPSHPVLYDADFDPGLASLCRGAGIEPSTISAEARGMALQLAGQLLREMLLGLLELNNARNELRNRFRIAEPAQDGNESPLDFSRGVDEALARLLSSTSLRAGSVDALRTHFRALKVQHNAVTAAMHAGFEDFVNRVDPKQLEERFERNAKRGVFGSNSKSKYWELYTEMFPGLAQRPEDGFPHAFVEAFAAEFEEKVRSLTPRRGSIGADRDRPSATGS